MVDSQAIKQTDSVSQLSLNQNDEQYPACVGSAAHDHGHPLQLSAG